MKKCLMVLVLLLTGAFASGADPVPPVVPVVPKAATTVTLPKTLSVILGKKCIVTATTTAKKVTWKVPAELDWVPIDAKSIAVWGTPDVYTISAHVPSGDDVVFAEMALTIIGPRPPPIDPLKPPVDPVKPPVVPPQPVTSFRVIFVHESGGTLPLGQTPVSDAKAIRDYLTANTTPDGPYAGFRKYDRDQTAAGETPAIKALWEAVQPKLTEIPCIVIEVNGKAEILPYPKNATDALALIKSKKEGK